MPHVFNWDINMRRETLTSKCQRMVYSIPNIFYLYTALKSRVNAKNYLPVLPGR